MSSDGDRGKMYGRKKFTPVKETSSGRGYYAARETGSSGFIKLEKESSDTQLKQPTILLKAREPTDDVVSSPKRSSSKENEQPASNTMSSSNNESSLPAVKTMTKSMKLLEDNVILTESMQEYFEENNDFLVVGVIGPQSVGKSTIINLLAHNKITDNLKKSLFKTLETSKSEDYGDNIKILTDNFEHVSVGDADMVANEIFKIETSDDLEKNLNCTNGVDLFITNNRVILLDCQPLCSMSALHDLVENEHKRSVLFNEFVPSENSAEIQGLQHTAFLMSVCHVLILVQDWFFDSNVVRFLQSAEMLKPSMSSSEDELVDHTPHLILLHNKATMENFTPKRFKMMQDIYKMVFSKSKLHLESNLGLGNGRLIHYLNKDNCGSPMNLFLIPDYDPHSNFMYEGHPDIDDLIKRLKANILGAVKNPLTHVQLTEKTWLIYCAKVWETIRKSSFFVEYTKLMP